MKKSLMFLAFGLICIGTYAQDDDVYFVPSSSEESDASDVYTASGRSSYAPIMTDEEDPYATTDNWAEGRGNCGRDVDEYNRRGRNYKSGVTNDSSSAQHLYDEGYDDGYEDGSCTARLVRFWSPRAGVYVSSPYYIDYFDLCYDPWYYGYVSPYWGWSWSGWYGWGSWYGYRPWHAGWGWDWYGPHGWDGFHGWRPEHLAPAGAQRGPGGGWVAYSGARAGGNGAYGVAGRNFGSNASRSFGLNSGRAATSRGVGANGRTRPVRSSSGTSASRSIGQSASRRTSRSSSTPSQSTTSSRSASRSFSTPSRSSSVGGSRSFSSPSRSGGFGGGGRSFGGGGGRSFGGRR